MTTKCPKNRVNRPAKSKMKGTADRNASEFNRPIAAKRQSGSFPLRCKVKQKMMNPQQMMYAARVAGYRFRYP